VDAVDARGAEAAAARGEAQAERRRSGLALNSCRFGAKVRRPCEYGFVA
jgi:hypothetical protein